jgi:hypothetical protein
VVDAIQAKTDQFVFTIANQVDANALTLSGGGDATQAKQDQIIAAVITNATGVDIAADIIAIKAETVLIVADTNELQTDDVPGLIAALVVPDAAGTAAGLHVTTDAAIAALNDIAATDIVSAGAITTLSGAVVNVDLVDTVTTNTDMRGTDSANTVVPDAAGTAAGLHVTTDAAIAAIPTTPMRGTDSAALATALTTAQNDLDLITGADGVTLATVQTYLPDGVIASTSKAGTLTTTAMSTNLTEVTDDHYIGRTIIWTTGVLLGQASDITDYVGVNGVLTFSTLTEAPGVGDGFIIV